jgi:hypothetical protein
MKILMAANARIQISVQQSLHKTIKLIENDKSAKLNVS